MAAIINGQSHFTRVLKKQRCFSDTLCFSSKIVTHDVFFFDTGIKSWENFEIECANYLNGNFSREYGCEFRNQGSHDATAPDIIVTKNGYQAFSIETKMPEAQCGQFVLKPDDNKHTFIFSPKNKCSYNVHVKAIIAAMEEHYDTCAQASSDDLPIPENLIYNWAKDYYINHKASRYFITGSNRGKYIIIPVDRLEKYFDFSAKYRIKASGSSVPSNNNRHEIETILDEGGFNHGSIVIEKKTAFVEISAWDDKLKLQGDKYCNQFKNIFANRYEIKRLANTHNANFIVSIRLKNVQQPEDIAQFCHDLAAIK